jgi:hypothetical protein
MAKNKKADDQQEHEITHEGSLTINNLQIPCFVLKDGTRILSGRGLQEALRIRDRVEGEKRGGYILPTFFKAKALKPFIDNKLKVAKLDPIICYRGEQVVHGYEATILADICDAILEARKAGAKLTDRQQTVADQAEMIIRALAKVGIIALIDEATGYQEVREKDALKQFLEKFLSEEKTKYIRTFPDEFFEMIFTMKGMTWKQANKGKKPQWVGHHINDFVYSRLGPEVLYSLRKLNPKNAKGHRAAKHPQYMSPEIGLPKLKEHLNILIALGKASGYNWNVFKRLVERALPQYSQDGSLIQQLPFNDVEDAEIIDEE